MLREKSSKVTKVPLAELRRLFVTESKSLEYMERRGKREKSSNLETTTHVHGVRMG